MSALPPDDAALQQEFGLRVDAASVDARVRAICRRQYLVRSRRAMVLDPWLAAGIAAMFAVLQPTPFWLGWWCIVATLELGCAFDAHRRLRGLDRHAASGRPGAHLALRGLAALAWGSGMTLVYGHADLELMFATVLIAYTAVGAYNQLPHRDAVLVYAGGLWVVPFVLCLVAGDTRHLMLAVGTAMLVLSLPAFLEGVRQQMVDAIAGRERADALTQALSEATRRIQQLATRDELTGLLNRRSALAELDRLSQHLPAEPVHDEARLGLLLIDVDHFKSVNDTHGHPAGDAVLREVAARLRRGLRPHDQVARIGGEEFLCMLPRVSQHEAERAAERVRLQLADTPIELGVLQLAVTVSIGVARQLPGESASRVLARIDEALYRAKRGGRDRVEPAREPEARPSKPPST